MFTVPVVFAFVLTAGVVLAVPGHSVVYVVTRSLEGGRPSGMASALGLSTGALIHATAACCGLAALLASTDWALTAVQIAGAAYLVYLGARQLRSNGISGNASSTPRGPVSARRLFADGVVVDVLNPTKVIFFLAFLPQFIDPGRGSPGTQLVVLALSFVPLAVLVYITYAVVAARIFAGMSQCSPIRARVIRCTGAVYIGLAALTLML